MIQLAHLGLGLIVLTSLSSPVMILGSSNHSTRIPGVRFSVVDDASLDNLSASSISPYGTCCMLKCLNREFFFLTMARYCFIRLSFASYSPCTYPTISWESLWTFTLLAQSMRARRSPMIINSYSASLLVALNLNLMAYSSLLFFGVMRTSPPSATLLEEPSMCTTHSVWSTFSYYLSFISIIVPGT